MNPDTGEIKQLDDDEKKRPQFYFRIDNLPNPNCKHCLGRGYIGRNEIGHVIPCRCVGKVSAVDNRGK